jgi:hypothetical protein
MFWGLDCFFKAAYLKLTYLIEKKLLTLSTVKEFNRYITFSPILPRKKPKTNLRLSKPVVSPIPIYPLYFYIKDATSVKNQMSGERLGYEKVFCSCGYRNNVGVKRC